MYLMCSCHMCRRRLNFELGILCGVLVARFYEREEGSVAFYVELERAALLASHRAMLSGEELVVS